MFLFFTNPYIIEYIKYRQTAKYISQKLIDNKVYDAAVVMGGFSKVNPETGNVSFTEGRAERLWEAVRLYKLGKIRKILITGDSSTLIMPDGSSNTDSFLKYMEDFGIPREAFVLEQNAKNTRENALFSKEILEKTGLDKDNILLITSALHMDRSLAAFKKVGMTPDYYAVGVYSPPGEFTHRSLYPRWKAATEWEELFNEIIGKLSYRGAGYI